MDKESLRLNPFLRADVLKRYLPMSKEQAEKIVNFVKRMTTVDATGIVVHCEAGISRSAAVAKWISDSRKIQLKGGKTDLHNRYVYRLLAEFSIQSLI
jgi:predicted protein tyrosine phosphatase